MKPLVFIVEGETEDEFVNRLLMPYLAARGLNTSMQCLMITMSGGGHGFNNIEHFRNTVRDELYRSDEPVITTFIDHYGINSETKLPGYNECVKERDTDKRIRKMEAKLEEAVRAVKPYRYFIPYIQRHEFETLLLADPESGFSMVGNERIKEDVKRLCSKFDSIEDINETPEGAPSKRLIDIYSRCNEKYEKATDAVDIAELTTINAMMEKCPHFREWVETLLKIL